MKERQSAMKSRRYQMLTGILSLSALGISMVMIRTLTSGADDIEEGTAVTVETLIVDYSALRPVIIALLLTLALFHVVQCIASYRESRLLFLKHLVYILSCAGSSVMLAFSNDLPGAIPYACFFYLAAAFIGCLFELIRKRSKWNVLLLIAMLLVTLLGGVSALIPLLMRDEQLSSATILSVILLFSMVDVQGVAAIMPLAFSSIRRDILSRIIKKTYAAEILLGIVLLILAFSCILPAFEPGIGNFGDALWYCFAIVTTIGFGDIYATSAIGRVLSVILGLYGIIVVSLITSIIVNFYGEMKKEEGDDGDGPDEMEPDDREPDEREQSERVHDKRARGRRDPEEDYGKRERGRRDPEEDYGKRARGRRDPEEDYSKRARGRRDPEEDYGKRTRGRRDPEEDYGKRTRRRRAEEDYGKRGRRRRAPDERVPDYSTHRYEVITEEIEL